MMHLVSNLLFFFVAAIDQEKTLKNIETFDKNQLRHSVTSEKNPLPDAESMLTSFEPKYE